MMKGTCEILELGVGVEMSGPMGIRRLGGLSPIHFIFFSDFKKSINRGLGYYYFFFSSYPRTNLLTLERQEGEGQGGGERDKH